MEGNYSIQIPEGATTLKFSFIGMKEVTEKIGNRTIINVIMEEDAITTDEVVVTALGIKREAKALSYSTQGVNMDGINDAKVQTLYHLFLEKLQVYKSPLQA